MALPTTGPISLSQINTELERSSTATVSLNTAEDGGYVALNSCSAIIPSATNPASMSEWRGYNHTASCGIACTSTQQTVEPAGCGVFGTLQVNLGGLVSGTVNVPYTYTLSSGLGYHQGQIYITYGPENVVANSGFLEVGYSPLPNSLSGTLTFIANGTYSYYTIHYVDHYCY